MFLVLEHYLNQPPHCLGFTQAGTVQPNQMINVCAEKGLSHWFSIVDLFLSFAQVFITLVQFVCFVV